MIGLLLGHKVWLQASYMSIDLKTRPDRTSDFGLEFTLGSQVMSPFRAHRAEVEDVNASLTCSLRPALPAKTSDMGRLGISSLELRTELLTLSPLCTAPHCPSVVVSFVQFCWS